MAKVEPSAKDKPRKFEHIYKDDDGCESIWKYDLDKFPNGPISVEQKYPPHYEKKLKAQQKRSQIGKEPINIRKSKSCK